MQFDVEIDESAFFVPAAVSSKSNVSNGCEDDMVHSVCRIGDFGLLMRIYCCLEMSQL